MNKKFILRAITVFGMAFLFALSLNACSDGELSKSESSSSGDELPPSEELTLTTLTNLFGEATAFSSISYSNTDSLNADNAFYIEKADSSLKFFTGNRLAKAYRITLSKERIVDAALQSNDFDTELYLYRSESNGTYSPVAQDTAKIHYKETGTNATYILVVTSLKKNKIGAYTLTMSLTRSLSDLLGNASAITAPYSAVGSLDSLAPYISVLSAEFGFKNGIRFANSYKVELTKGKIIDAALQSSDFATDLYLYRIESNGAYLLVAQDTAKIHYKEDKDKGQYILIASSLEENKTGLYTLTMSITRALLDLLGGAAPIVSFPHSSGSALDSTRASLISVSGDELSFKNGNRYANAHKVTLAKGQTIDIVLHSNNFAPDIYLYRDNGSGIYEFVKKQSGAIGSDASIRHSEDTAPNTYILVVTSSEAEKIGAYTLSLTVAASLKDILDGAAVVSSLIYTKASSLDSAAAKYIYVPTDTLNFKNGYRYASAYRVDLVKGQFLDATLQGSAFDKDFYLYRDKGEGVYEFVASDSKNATNANAARISYEDTLTASYVLVVSTISAKKTGAYTLNLSIKIRALTDLLSKATPISSFPHSSSGYLDSSRASVVSVLADTINFAKGVRYANALKITLSANQTLDIVLSSNNFNPQVYLYKDKGAGIYEYAGKQSSTAGSAASILYREGSVPNTYILVVTSSGENEIGAYTLSITLATSLKSLLDDAIVVSSLSYAPTGTSLDGTKATYVYVDASDATLEFKEGYRYANAYRVNLVKGQFLDATLQGSAFDKDFYLYKDNGNGNYSLDTIDSKNAAGGVAARISYEETTASASYVLVVSTLSAKKTGAYTFNLSIKTRALTDILSKAPAVSSFPYSSSSSLDDSHASVVSVLDAELGFATGVRYANAHKITLAKNQTLDAVLSSNNFAPNIYLYRVKSAGSYEPVSENDMIVISENNASIHYREGTAPNTYILVVTSSGENEIGAYTLSLKVTIPLADLFGKATTVSSLTYTAPSGSALNGTGASFVYVSGNELGFKSGYRYANAYRVDLVKGQFLDAVLKSNTFDSDFYLYREYPTGVYEFKKMESSNASDVNPARIRHWEQNAPSSYILVVTSSSPEKSGAYEFISSIKTIDTHYSEFTDGRDGNVYHQTTIGSQTWMVENLKYSLTGGNFWCYDNGDIDNPVDCGEYGLLYDWETAMAAQGASTTMQPKQGICPNGWHVPSDPEWITLIKYVEEGADSTAGIKLKDAAEGTLWAPIDYNPEGFDEYHFTAKPGGAYYSSGSFENFGLNGYWWTSTVSGSDATARYMLYDRNEMYSNSYSKKNGYSVRCIRD
ncbi:hypothetical protein AGMMS49938_00290 [Fibrobacterales bacterium]|nr:hypothetical protein AGMMS49938_00290 [Fibrobacterales bacterium]